MFSAFFCLAPTVRGTSRIRQEIPWLVFSINWSTLSCGPVVDNVDETRHNTGKSAGFVNLQVYYIV